MLQEFKNFVLRGNAVDLAVGIVVGAAFSSIVTALVADIFTPFVSAIVKVPDLSRLFFVINDSRFAYGHFLNTLISFFFVATATFFLIVKPMNLLTKLNRKDTPTIPTTKKCKECLSDIPLEARRCAHCAEPVL